MAEHEAAPGSTASRSGPIGSVDVAIGDLREHAELVVPRVDLLQSQVASASDPWPQVQWLVEAGLQADEGVIVFSKPLLWTDSQGPPPGGLPLLPDGFRESHVRSSPRTAVWGEPARVRGSGNADAVRWAHGVVLPRGQDRPSMAQSCVRIRRR